jgi:hypothetical protein
MARKSFIFILLACLWITGCGTKLITATESKFESINTQPATSADLDLYRSLSEQKAAPADRTELAIEIEKLNPALLPTPPTQPVQTYQVGDTRTFWVHNGTTFEYKQITAKLMFISKHAYFWQDVNNAALNAAGTEATSEDWAAAGDSFDTSYERVRAVFGSEETPGLDGDPRLFVVNSDSLGKEGGHFSQADQLPAAVEAHSNEGQYFFISNTWSSGIASNYYKEVLAHEYQHMIHKHVDPDEEGWLNEGLSMLAQQIAGMRGDNWVSEYFITPDQSLWYWSSTSADYGQSYLYLEYIYELFGDDFIKALAANQSNGLKSIDETLTEFNSPRNADELYMDALTAAFFNNPAMADGQFAYKTPKLTPMVPKYAFKSTPGIYQGTVQQYGGVDIITFTGKGKANFTFTGDQLTKLLPTEAHSGENFWWSSRNDSSFTTLTHTVDLSNTSSATLNYWAWYNIEEDWDYAYLMVSTDNGAHWDLVPATSSRKTDPNKQNLGHGFSGLSGGGTEAVWIEETADLTPYAGKQILIRFAMQNDLVVNNYGFAIDDLSIPEIQWSDDIEAENSEWTSGGFIRIHNSTPQVWNIRVVEQTGDNSIVVHDLEVTQGTAQLDINLSEMQRLVVFVIGQTRYTTIPATYQVEVVK